MKHARTNVTITEAFVKVFVTNLGKYNEGLLIGQWLSLPCTEEELNNCLTEIGINEEYEEYFLTDWDSSFDVDIREYSNINELNEIAEMLVNLHPYQLEQVEALIENYGYTFEDAVGKLEEVISFEIEPSWGESEENTNLAYGYIDLMGGIEMLGKKELENRFNYEAFERDLNYEGIYTEEEIKEIMENLEVSELSLETLETYFDYEYFGRDLKFDMTIASNNIVTFDI